ncbi:MAG: histidine--tRNA ligase [Anaerolineales bacterium]
MPLIPPVKGTRDFYPEPQARQRWLREKIRTVSESFGYQEYEAPYLERLDLYAARSGEELVRKQSFVFQDRGGDWVALRPELTPSLARMVATRRQEIPQPIRWWSFGPFWRYERPQRGRTREFWQWNVDLLGVESPWADAELAAVAAEFFRSAQLGPQTIRILVNDRRLVEGQLRSLSIPDEEHLNVLHWIDRRDAMPLGTWREGAAEIGLTDRQVQDLQTLLEQTDAWRQSEELVEFFEAVSAMGAQEYIAYSPTVVRGLDYYTGIVFEARDAGGMMRAILGGGRYDNLVADVGGDPIPGVGFAMGDVVLGLLLDEAHPAGDPLPISPTQVLVLTFPDVSLTESVRLAAELRRQGFRTEWYPQADRVPKQLKYADRQKIPVAAMLGPDEVGQGTVTLKDLRAGRQVTIARSEAGRKIATWLVGPRA